MVSGLWLPAAGVSDFSKYSSGCWLQHAGAGRDVRVTERLVDGAGSDLRPEWGTLGIKEEKGLDLTGQVNRAEV